MKFFASATTAATFFAGLASAYNGFITPAEGDVAQAGKPCLIKWVADTEGQVTITLMKGARKNLDEISQVVMLEYNWGNYTWDIPADTPAGKDYALKLKWGKDPRPEDVNYTGLFEITSNAKEDDQKSTTKTSKPTTTVSDSATETATATETSTEETATETVTTKPGGDQTHTIANTTMTYTPTGSKTSTTKTTSSPTSTSTAPSSHDSDASACSVGASVGMAAVVAVAAAALL